MRGEVLHYDEAHGFGFITGEDGNRYTFRREDLTRSFPLARGVTVEFHVSGDQARAVSP
jgi:cold shock CspA family protein